VKIPWFKPEPLEVPLPDVGPLPDSLFLHPFGALVACAVLVGASMASRRAREEGLNPRVMGEMAAYVLIGGFVLGHVLDAIFYHWDVVREDPLFVLQLWNGLSSFGGFVGATIGGLIWIWHRGYPLVPFADITSYAFPFGWIFGRLGCFVVHDHPGVVTDFPLAVADYHVRGLSPPWQPRHDLGLYEVFWCLAVIPLFLWLGRKKRPRGFYFALLPLLYAPVRFGLDFLRASDAEGGDPRILLGLTPGHYGAILLFAGGLFVMWWVMRRPRYDLPREVRWTAEDDGREDPRGVDELLGTGGEPRGAAIVTEPDAEAERVARWPAGVLVIDARGVDDLEALREQLEAMGPQDHHVWLVDDPSDAVAELASEVEANESTRAVAYDADPEAVAEALGAPTWTHEGDEAPWVVLERDDGGMVFGMRGEPAAG